MFHIPRCALPSSITHQELLNVDSQLRTLLSRETQISVKSFAGLYQTILDFTRDATEALGGGKVNTFEAQLLTRLIAEKSGVRRIAPAGLNRVAHGRKGRRTAGGVHARRQSPAGKTGICRASGVSLPPLRRHLCQRRAANRCPIDRVHGRSEPRLDLFEGLPFSE